LALASAILILGVFPFYDKSKIRSMEFRPLSKIAFWFFVADCIVLGWIGTQPVEEPYVTIGREATLFYFTYFVALQPTIVDIENELYFLEDLEDKP
jgi:ubiquinol-cytochrome c reductase cytochrome b subunit